MPCEGNTPNICSLVPCQMALMYGFGVAQVALGTLSSNGITMSENHLILIDMSRSGNPPRNPHRIAESRSRGVAESRSRGIAESRSRGVAESQNRGIAESRSRGVAESRSRGVAELRSRGIAESRRTSQGFLKYFPRTSQGLPKDFPRTSQ